MVYRYKQITIKYNYKTKTKNKMNVYEVVMKKIVRNVMRQMRPIKLARPDLLSDGLVEHKKNDPTAIHEINLGEGSMCV